MKKDEIKKLPDLHHPKYYNNRELSWLFFNERVLEEALDESNPLLERIKFLAIFSSNLDEFFMVRVAGLKDQVEAGFNKPENKSGLTPKQQLRAISEINRKLVKRQDTVYTETMLPLLKQEYITFNSIEELTSEEQAIVKKHFRQYIFPVLTPMAVDAYRPFPMLLSKSINLAVMLQDLTTKGEPTLAIVQVPSVLSRFIEIKEDDPIQRTYVLLEDVISHCIDLLFPGYKVLSVSPFRITRNADLSLHEEGARDLLREIEKELKKRKWGAAVRLEIQQGLMDHRVERFLMKELEIHENDIYTLKGPLDLTFLFEFYKELGPEYEHLTNQALIPQPPADLLWVDDIFDAIDHQDILLHHPYESFQPVVDFIQQAAEDPKVLAIKQTLYRVGGDSPIIAALLKAAENGKQVTVLVELKARFDEENNIQWARMLEKSGVHVIYGFTGLKTHSKITLVVRLEGERIQRYVHLGTGNYNETTAKQYTDIGLLTSRSSFGEDATHFFNYLSGYSEKPQWNEIAATPFETRDYFLQLIDEEITSHHQHGNGYIQAKMNSLTDKPIILKLYEASRAGVKIDLLIRGICCLRPGIPEISENIRVRSIIDRFLEHSRIFYFYQGGMERYFLSSADWMTRNMEKRVEILFPVYDARAKKKLQDVFTFAFSDNVKAREQLPDGTYAYVQPQLGEPLIRSQLELYNQATPFEDEVDD
ncbi:RNA degradosome polyphosphate kinase [Salsuginibacillus kocurii]|uniref:RNA degradosome polyphosphate kinase n=1 Tax=Salsuginibacillus kocurii TaxID=427078 RepID=UPI000361CF7D|nr:RNA degradosome polyphosphate kinase [Salsuginibacillus kocurii]